MINGHKQKPTYEQPLSNHTDQDFSFWGNENMLKGYFKPLKDCLTEFDEKFKGRKYRSVTEINKNGQTSFV